MAFRKFMADEGLTDSTGASGVSQAGSRRPVELQVLKRAASLMDESVTLQFKPEFKLHNMQLAGRCLTTFCDVLCPVAGGGSGQCLPW
jgi:hypothetical protein